MSTPPVDSRAARMADAWREARCLIARLAPLPEGLAIDLLIACRSARQIDTYTIQAPMGQLRERLPEWGLRLRGRMIERAA